MGRGGARVGAGRKPASVYVLPPAVTGSAPAVSVGSGVSMEAPAHLTEAERAVWVRYAPLAQQRGTLTEATVPGFEYLCSVVAQYEALRDRIDADGWTFVKVTIDGSGQEHQEQRRHTLWSPLQAFALRREQALRSYGLLANGKPPGGGPAPVNPWADIAAG